MSMKPERSERGFRASCPVGRVAGPGRGRRDKDGEIRANGARVSSAIRIEARPHVTSSAIRDYEVAMKTTRRQFLSAAAAAPVLGPIILGAQDKAGSKAPVLGQGAFTYEAIHDWGELPASIKWGNTHGVVEDSQGNIHIHHTVHATSERADSVVVFDSRGKFIRSWGRQFRGVAHGL